MIQLAHPLLCIHTHQGHHCVVDVSATEAKALIACGLQPIIIFLKPASSDIIAKQNPAMAKDSTVEAYHLALQVCPSLLPSFHPFD